MMKFATLCVSGAILALGATAEITASQKVDRVVSTTQDDGTVSVALVPAETVVPGETLAYSLNWTNDAAETAENAVFTVPVPEEVVYIDGSATSADAVVTFSADQGNTFAARDELVIADADKTAPAQAGDITHVRWTFSEGVAGNSSGTLIYKAVLK